MNPTELWAFGLVATAIAGLGVTLWRHMVTCSKEVAVPLAKLATQMEQFNIFIGELRTMKHMKVDPYLPREFDHLKERVDRLSEKIEDSQ